MRIVQKGVSVWVRPNLQSNSFSMGYAYGKNESQIPTLYNTEKFIHMT